ncbi:hypothetical protein TCAL_09097 [Tigriopus californicus]|uniref:Uncharacterized protein n=1 Tax=Tigriopus californicus TaxID=6832 RepID=A0A553N8I6_TIGCA|nr:hypothetical protein TCAL_09097 [Tigriopus californicus]
MSTMSAMSVSAALPPPSPAQPSLRSKMVRQIEKPRPLLKHSTSLIQPPVSSKGDSKLAPIEAVQSPEDCLALLGSVIQSYQMERFGSETQNAIVALNAALKIYGTQIEAHYKDQLNAAMLSIQKACKDDRLNLISRIYFLEIVELRVMEWKMDENVSKYYKQKLAHLELYLLSKQPLYARRSFFVHIEKDSHHKSFKNPGHLKSSRTIVIHPFKRESSSYEGYKGCEVLFTGAFQMKMNMQANQELSNTSSPSKRGLKTDRSVSLNANAPQFIPPDVMNPPPKLENDQSKVKLSASSMNELVIRNPDSGRGHLNGISVNPKTESEKYQHLVHIGQEKIRISGDSLELVQAAKLVLDDFFTSNPKVLRDPGSFPQNNTQENPLTKHVGVVRQPLFPAATKEAFSAAKSSNLVENRRSLFAKTSAERLIRDRMDEKVLPKPSSNLVPEDTEEKVSSPSKLDLVYDRDAILKIADAPLSQVKPFNWNDILAEFPCLERKHADFKNQGPRNLPLSDPNFEPSPIPIPKKDLALRDRLDFSRPEAQICVWNAAKGEWVPEMSPVESQTNPLHTRN